MRWEARILQSGCFPVVPLFALAAVQTRLEISSWHSRHPRGKQPSPGQHCPEAEPRSLQQPPRTGGALPQPVLADYFCLGVGRGLRGPGGGEGPLGRAQRRDRAASMQSPEGLARASSQRSLPWFLCGCGPLLRYRVFPSARGWNSWPSRSAASPVLDQFVNTAVFSCVHFWLLCSVALAVGPGMFTGSYIPALIFILLCVIRPVACGGGQ